ncbi:MAG: sensor domain-containing diguanylate cyclase [Bauldia litoralis]
MNTDVTMSAWTAMCRSFAAAAAGLRPARRTAAATPPAYYHDQVRSLARTAKTTALANLLNGAIVMTVLVSGGVPLWLGAAWFLALLAAVSLRIRLIGRLPVETDQEGIARWLNAFTWRALLSGTIWSGVGLLLFQGLDPARTILVVMVVAGMAAGAAAANSAHARTAIAFMTPTLLPVFAYFALGGTAIDLAMAALVLVFFVTLVKVARTIEASILRAIASEAKAAALSEELSAIANYTYGWESWLSDAGTLRWVNPSVKRVTGYTPEECRAMPDYPLPIFHPDDRKTVIEAMRQSAERGEMAKFSARIIRKNGQERWVDVVRHPAKDSRGRPFGFRASVKDVTERILLTRQLEAQAQTDPLTGLCNRRHFARVGEREIGRTRRFGRPLTFAIIDIDRFKAINDRFGHKVGDDCLAAFATLCVDNLRVSDIIARWGGEEFALLMPETDVCQAATICERLREMTEELTVETEAGPARFTVSMGLAQIKSGESMEAVMTRADQALYEAKGQGRNRIVLEDTSEIVVV